MTRFMYFCLLPAMAISIALPNAAEAQNSQSGTSPRKPRIAFPPTPTPQPPPKPMTEAELNQYFMPSAMLSETSSVLAIVYNGFRHSMIDPCGCVVHQLGGLDKEATLIDRLEAQKVPDIKVDAGGFLRDMPSAVDMIRANYVLKGLGKIGYDAVNVGFTDIGDGVEKLKKSAADAGVKLVSANIVGSDDRPVFDPYIIKDVTVGGKVVKVGIVGVTRPRVPFPRGVTTGTGTAAAEVSATSGSVTVLNPTEALNKVLPALKTKANFIVILDYDRRERAAELVTSLADKSDVDVVVTGEFLQAYGNAQDVDGVKVVSGGYEGRMVGMLFANLENDKIKKVDSKFIEIVQSIPSDPAITAIMKESKKAVESQAPAAGADESATKLKLN